MLPNKVKLSGVNTFKLAVLSSEKMKELFSEKEIVDLVVAINNINSWNKLNITLS